MTTFAPSIRNMAAQDHPYKFVRMARDAKEDVVSSSTWDLLQKDKNGVTRGHGWRMLGYCLNRKGDPAPGSAPSGKVAPRGPQVTFTPPEAAPAPVNAPAPVPDPNGAIETDFTILDGIGPKASAALNAAGVNTITQLALAHDAHLRDIMVAAGMKSKVAAVINAKNKMQQPA